MAKSCCQKLRKVKECFLNIFFLHLYPIFNVSIFFLMQGDVDVPYIVPQEFRDMSRQLQNPEDLEKLQHPVTMTTWRYVLGDCFRNKSNPHKSPLCVYHDIDKCQQSLTIKTSYQEVENSRKNQWHLRSPCAQSCGTHFLFNYLMDYYQNEAIVQSQQLRLESMLKDDETIARDVL